MRFTIIELRKVLPLDEANRLLIVLNSQKKVVPKKVSRYIPFKSKYGTESTQLQVLNQYDIDELIEEYENRLTSLAHRHIYKKTLHYTKLFHKIKSLL